VQETFAIHVFVIIRWLHQFNEDSQRIVQTHQLTDKSLRQVSPELRQAAVVRLRPLHRDPIVKQEFASPSTIAPVTCAKITLLTFSSFVALWVSKTIHRAGFGE
jgi:hypothetical protein